tara:strand:- start:7065 stop:7385 length:321 start_codon:yes stop_codon:yes gene_type:complete
LVYVFDIDNTICYTNNSDYQNSVPMEERISKINALYAEGHTIIFQTARGMGRSNNCAALAIKNFKAITEKQLKDWDVKYHDLFLGKPSGDVYIDDKGVKDEQFFAN